MNIRWELLIYIMSIVAISGKNHHHHHHHGNGLNQKGRHRRRSKRRCIQKILDGMGGEPSSASNGIGRSTLDGAVESPLVLPPGTKKSPSNIDFLITEDTPDNRPSEYKPAYSNSKVYKITANKDVDASFILLSTEKNFFPQVKISKASGSSLSEAVPSFSGSQSAKSYQIKKGENVVIEIGYDKNLSSSPFSNSTSTGGFRLIMSLNGKSLENYLENSKIATGSDYSGTVVTTPGAPLLLSGYIPNLNHGTFDIKVTPYYNLTKNSITLYYHNGSNLYTGSVYRNSKVEQVCKEDADVIKVAKGREPSGGSYVWDDVPSKKICDLKDFLKEFN